MMMNANDIAHPADDQLLQIILDWEGDEDDTGAREHLAGCDICERRVVRLREQMQGVFARISEIDLPPEFSYPTLPTRTPRRWAGVAAPRGSGAWLRAAAVAALLVGGALIGVPPLRAWVVNWVEARWAELTASTPGSEQGQVPHDALPPAAPGSTVLFTPRGNEFAIEILHPQRAGRVEVQTHEVAMGSVEVVPGGGDETPLIRESGLTIANQSGSLASYRVILPTGVERVHLRIGTGAGVVLTRDQLLAGYVAELGSSGP